MLFEIPCPDGISRVMLCVDNTPAASNPPAPDAGKPEQAPQAEPVKESPVQTVDAEPTSVEQTAEETPAEESTPEALPIGETLQILDQSQRHEDTLKQLEALVRVSRNHPSVFLYCIYNEEVFWQAEERGYRMARQMRAHVRALDDTRAVTAAMNGGVLAEVNVSDALDVIGMNYDMNVYEECHRRTPHKTILGTENCPTFATRGVYISDDKEQVFNSYGDHWASFGESIEECMECVEEKAYNAGFFAWSGFDFYRDAEPNY